VTIERFVPQLVRSGAPLCILCGGQTMNGLNCTCAAEAMWLYRASQGRFVTDACHVRDLTDDCVGGTNLGQMQAVSAEYRLTGTRYQPTDVATIFALVRTNRYGAHLNISYAPVVDTSHDAFFGRFTGNHDIYLSARGASIGTIRVGDPGATGFHDWPETLLAQAAGLLDLGAGETLNSEYGRGKCYAYLTPIDPDTTWWPDYAGIPPSSATFAVQFRPGTYPRFNQYGGRTGTFTTAGGFTAYGNTRKRLANGHLLGRLITDRPGYFVDTATAARYWSK